MLEPSSYLELPKIHIIHSVTSWTAFTYAHGLYPNERVILLLTGEAVTLVFDIDQRERMHDLTVAGTIIMVTACDFAYPRSTLRDLPSWLRIEANLPKALEALGLLLKGSDPWL